MFAYCLNNPMNCVDSTGNRAHNHFAYTYSQGDGGSYYITDQYDSAIADMSFGLATVSHGGCGPIATYNALITLGEHKRFRDVLSYYNQNVTKLNVFGLAGTPTNLVAQYFRDNGYSVYITDDMDAIDVLSKSADASILWYMFPATYGGVDLYGAHFVAYEREGSGYRGYNTAEENGSRFFSYASDYGYSRSRYYSIGLFIFK